MSLLTNYVENTTGRFLHGIPQPSSPVVSHVLISGNLSVLTSKTAI